MKPNPFISSELQKTPKKISDMQLDYVQKILPSFASSSSFQQMQEILTAPYKELVQSCATVMSSSFTSSLSKMSESINSTICSSLTAGIYNSLNESLKNAFPLLEFQQYIQDVIPKLQLPSQLSDYSENLYKLPPADDYVIVDEPVAKTYEIPDSIAIPIGSQRVKLSTSLFFAIIQTILNTIVSISIAIAQSNPAAIEAQQK